MTRFNPTAGVIVFPRRVIDGGIQPPLARRGNILQPNELFGLIAPDGCGMRVGSETRSWSEGECLIFDDTVEHEAWNHAGHARVVLLFDFLRPEVNSEMRDEPPAEVRDFVSRQRK